MSEDDVKRLFCEFISEICESVFNHDEQAYFVEINEDAFADFEAKLGKSHKG